jgi:integrase/recombinase XerD
MKCQDAQRLWLAETDLAGSSSRTLHVYRSNTDEAFSWFALNHDVDVADLEIDAITRDDIVDALSRYQARPDKRTGADVTRSAGSLSTFYGAMHSFFAWCIKTEKLDKNPVGRVSAPKIPRRIPKAMSTSDCQKLLANVSGSRTPERDRLALLLGMAMGLRLGEMATLTPESFLPSCSEAVLLRVVGKGDKERIVPVPESVRDALADYLVVREAVLSYRGHQAATLFLAGRARKDGSRDVSREGLGQSFDRMVCAAGLKERGRRAHVTRHSFATHVLSGGADILSVSELLGHSSVATTQIYLKVDPARLSSAVQANAIFQ